MEFDGTLRTSSTNMNNVEIQFGGQKDTPRAAVRIEGATANSHTLKNCAIHSGPAWIFNGFRSKSITLDNNVFWGGKQFGVRMDSV